MQQVYTYFFNLFMEYMFFYLLIFYCYARIDVARCDLVFIDFCILGGYYNITSLRDVNKNLKVMIGIGGWTEGSLGFGRITANETNRKEFAKNAVRFLRGYKFDGLDLNWQHPTFREGGSPEDRENYVLLAHVRNKSSHKL